jgi:hypothetical protein
MHNLHYSSAPLTRTSQYRERNIQRSTLRAAARWYPLASLLRQRHRRHVQRHLGCRPTSVRRGRATGTRGALNAFFACSNL